MARKDSCCYRQPRSFFLTATECFETHYQVLLKLSYKEISQVFADVNQSIAIIDLEEHRYHFISLSAVTASNIEENLKRTITPLRYHQ